MCACVRVRDRYDDGIMVSFPLHSFCGFVVAWLSEKFSSMKITIIRIGSMLYNKNQNKENYVPQNFVYIRYHIVLT